MCYLSYSVVTIEIMLKWMSLSWAIIIAAAVVLLVPRGDHFLPIGGSTPVLVYVYVLPT